MAATIDPEILDLPGAVNTGPNESSGDTDDCEEMDTEFGDLDDDLAVIAKKVYGKRQTKKPPANARPAVSQPSKQS